MAVARQSSAEQSVSPVAVVVVTRNRVRDLEVCLTAILSSKLTDFELIVVDQSEGQESADLVREFAERDRRVHLVQDVGRGAARARNLGVEATRAEIIAFTDDDCEPDPRWLGLLVRALADDSTAGIAFGAVLPAPYDRDQGFIVGFAPKRFARMHGRLAKLRDMGISANVALRREALLAVGGFDEMLGPGSYFTCAEDYDLTYRVLARGYTLLHLPSARVLHYGLRDWRSGSALIFHTYVAIGAAYMKHIRVRDIVGLVLLLQEFERAALNIAINVARGRRPFGVGRMFGLFVGMWRSFELNVDARVLYSRTR